MKEFRTYLIAATGGPGAGKSDSLPEVARRMSDQGFNVHVGFEAATRLINAGAKPWEMTAEQHFDFQVGHVAMQLAHEKEMLALAQGNQGDSIILCDRGLMDGAAYIGMEVWPRVLAANGLDLASASTNRYDAVIHLESLAKIDASKYPGRANPARWQDPAGAARSDADLLRVWKAHPHHRIISAREEFNTKLDEFTSAVLECTSRKPLRSRPEFLPLHPPTGTGFTHVIER